MASWRPNSLTVLALATGAFWTGAVAPCASAGDKIDFSTPSTSLVAPRVERESPEQLKSDQPPLISTDELFLQNYGGDAGGAVYTPAPKRRGDSTSEDRLKDLRDQGDDVYSYYDDLDAKQLPVNAMSNLWEAREGWDRESDRAFADRRDGREVEGGVGDESANHYDLRSRLDTVRPEGITEYQKDERYDSQGRYADKDRTWTGRTFRSHEPLGMDSIHEKQFEPLYEELGTLNQRPAQNYPATRAGGASDLTLRDSLGQPDGLAEFNALRDAERGKTEVQQTAPIAPRTLYPVERQPAMQNNDAFLRQEPPPSPPGQVQSRPAVLPFPKRPGDLLQ